MALMHRRRLLQHLEIDRIKKAIAAVVAEGKVRTYDMLRLVGGPDVLKKGAASTEQMTDAVIARL